MEKEGGTMLAALLCLMEKSLLRRSDCLSSAWEKVLMNITNLIILAALLCLMEKSLLRRSDCLSSAWEKGTDKHNKLKGTVYKRENFLGSDIEICTFS